MAKDIIFNGDIKLKINVTDLKKQKNTLMDYITKNDSDEDLLAILSILDHIQDELVDTHSLNENDVYEFVSE